MAPNKTVYHVVPDAGGEQWVVTEEHGELREAHPTKHEAVTSARERARGQQPSQVKVHKRDGNMEYENTYGDDPTRSPS